MCVGAKVKLTGALTNAKAQLPNHVDLDLSEAGSSRKRKSVTHYTFRFICTCTSFLYLSVVFCLQCCNVSNTTLWLGRRLRCLLYIFVLLVLHWC